MTQRWTTLTFLHWAYRPDLVQALLPAGLQVETMDGRAWVGLVPFHMTVGPARLSSLPWIGTFHETNLRTYVRDRTGRSGVWFFSMDAARLGAVAAARASYGLPYFWSAMTLTRDGNVVRYVSSRRWPGLRGAANRVEVEIGSALPATALTELDHFLTARWTLFSVAHGHLRDAQVSHEPWPLRRAEVRQVEDELILAAGLPPVPGAPLAHFSFGVTARVSALHRVAGS